MSLVTVDPDSKIGMSLDEIIRLTNGQANGGNPRKRKRPVKKKRETASEDHSVPLQSRLGGGYIYVTKKSPLLSITDRRKIIQAISNRVLNSELIDKTKEIIPATYKIVKTAKGLERILVPAEDQRLRPLRKSMKNQNKESRWPPPLTNTLIFSPPGSEADARESDDEIVVLESTTPKKKPPVIDVESNLPVDAMGAPWGFLSPANFSPETGVKLNDRFTLLTGASQF